jgi:hypothetical protein
VVLQRRIIRRYSGSILQDTAVLLGVLTAGSRHTCHTHARRTHGILLKRRGNHPICPLVAVVPGRMRSAARSRKSSASSRTSE